MHVEQLFPRGFLLHESDVPVDVPTGWAQTALPHRNWMLSHDPKLDLDIRETNDKSSWVAVVGLCLYAGDGDSGAFPALRLAEALGQSRKDFLDQLDMLAGRFVVITVEADEPIVRHDAMGLRSVYFSPSARLVGTHANLLQQVWPHDLRTNRTGLSTMLTSWSRTPYLGMDALLPNHELRIADWSVHRYYPREANHYTKLSVAERIDLFRSRWTRQLDDLRSRHEDLVMSLTGGADSRTGLALCWEHRKDLSMFTYTANRGHESQYRASLSRDRAIVDKLLEIMPDARHDYFYLDDQVTQLSEQQQHVQRQNTIGRHGAWLMPHYLREFTDREYIHLRGSGFEVGRAYWDARPETDSVESLMALFRFRHIKSKSKEPFAEAMAYFREGLQRWEYLDNLHGVHLRDLYYWEIRMGRWASEIHNETDLAFETCVMINSRSLLEITLSFPVEDRRTGYFFAELINDAAPLLNFFGKNDLRNLYEITRDERREIDFPEEPTISPLTADLQIRTPRAEQLEPAEGNLLHLPQTNFIPGHSARRSFISASSDGELRFTLTSTYANPTAGDYWRTQIWVNDHMHTSWAAGTSNTPVHVTITDLHAGDVVSVAVAALIDRRHASSWSRATRTRIDDTQFDPRPTIGQPSVGVDAPRATSPSRAHGPLRLTYPDLTGLSRTDLPADTPTRLDVDLETCTLPLLVIRRECPGDDSVLCLFNGAVDLAKSQGQPVFQRSTWSKDIPLTQIFVADPATVGPGALSLAWGQISRHESIVPEVLKALRLLCNVLGAQFPENRTYFGSSAGGFWAWSASVLDPGSRAVVNNAQVDWTRWMSGSVKELCEKNLGGALPSEMRADPTRTSALSLWKHQKVRANVDYWVNLSSPHDRKVDLPSVESFAREYPDLTQNLRIFRYEDEASKHNPMDREKTLRAILNPPPQEPTEGP